MEINCASAARLEAVMSWLIVRSKVYPKWLVYRYTVHKLAPQAPTQNSVSAWTKPREAMTEVQKYYGEEYEEADTDKMAKYARTRDSWRCMIRPKCIEILLWWWPAYWENDMDDDLNDQSLMLCVLTIYCMFLFCIRKRFFFIHWFFSQKPNIQHTPFLT